MQKKSKIMLWVAVCILAFAAGAKLESGRLNKIHETYRETYLEKYETVVGYQGAIIDRYEQLSECNDEKEKEVIKLIISHLGEVIEFVDRTSMSNHCKDEKLLAEWDKLVSKQETEMNTLRKKLGMGKY